MFSTTVSIIIAAGFISFVSGVALKRKSPYDVASKCTKAGWDSDVSALRSGGGPKNEAEIIEGACIYLREFSRCIVNTNPDDYASRDPNIVHFLVAHHWQQIIIAKKAGLCKDMPIEELKKITMESEEDSYKECVGDVMRKCMIRGETSMKQGISQDFLSAMTDYINCYEEAGYGCDAEMLHHFIVFLKAYRRHLEENKEKFGKMVGKIPLPKQ